MNKKIITLVITSILFSILYRVLPYRVDGFNPLIALSLFSGFALSSNKKMAFAVPLITMFLSDVVYQILFATGNGTVQGFYGWWQIAQYASIAVVAIIGFYINKLNVLQVGASSIVAATVFFILSNFFVWVEGMGYQHSYTFTGLMKCYADGIPFYKASVASAAIFSVVLFGAYYVIAQKSLVKQEIK